METASGGLIIRPPAESHISAMRQLRSVSHKLAGEGYSDQLGSNCYRSLIYKPPVTTGLSVLPLVMDCQCAAKLFHKLIWPDITVPMIAYSGPRAAISSAVGRSLKPISRYQLSLPFVSTSELTQAIGSSLTSPILFMLQDSNSNSAHINREERIECLTSWVNVITRKLKLTASVIMPTKNRDA